MNYYLLSATGKDHPGFVSELTKVLFEQRCNLEDSSMMRLGSEFGIFLIFTSKKILTEMSFQSLRKEPDLSLTFKKISARLARFTPSKKESYIIRIHGQDQPGIVYHVTKSLAAHGFNITDLSTHRTVKGRLPGYIVLIEGELSNKTRLNSFEKDLRKIAGRLKTRVSIDSIPAQSF